jgi:hypothetical protein
LKLELETRNLKLELETRIELAATLLTVMFFAAGRQIRAGQSGGLREQREGILLHLC